MTIKFIDTKTEPELLDAIFRLRHEVFKKRLGWDIDSPIARDIDQFDSLDVTYCVALDPAGTVEGCFRLLPTPGPYMLKDVFPQLLHGAVLPSSPRILESTKFAVLPCSWRHNAKHALITLTCELLIAQVEYCLARQIEQVVSVTDVRFEKILRASGLVCERYGPPIRVGNTIAVAGWQHPTEQNLQSLRTTYRRLRARADRQTLVSAA